MAKQNSFEWAQQFRNGFAEKTGIHMPDANLKVLWRFANVHTKVGSSLDDYLVCAMFPRMLLEYQIQIVEELEEYLAEKNTHE